ncbi:hypothetical protein BJ742DRAFT_781378 [Cladochytrium replicatum]|nr:hypothetical protein BJ742DRAFT_781378 [Cladochytrium replicatum]
MPSVFQTPLSGSGNGGSPFDDHASLTSQGLKPLAVAKIAVRAGLYIDSIQFSYRVLTPDEPTPRVYTPGLRGGDGGTLHETRLAEGEFVIVARGRAGGVVEGIEFVIANARTREVRTFGPFGSMKEPEEGSRNAGIKFGYMGPIVGIGGRCGMYLDGLWFHYVDGWPEPDGKLVGGSKGSMVPAANPWLS